MRRYLLPDEVNTTGFTGAPGPSEESGSAPSGPGTSGHSGYFGPSGPGSPSEVKVRGEEFHYLIHVYSINSWTMLTDVGACIDGGGYGESVAGVADDMVGGDSLFTLIVNYK